MPATKISHTKAQSTQRDFFVKKWKDAFFSVFFLSPCESIKQGVLMRYKQIFLFFATENWAIIPRRPDDRNQTAFCGQRF